MITQLGILSLTCEDLVLDLDLEHFFLVTRLAGVKYSVRDLICDGQKCVTGGTI